MRGGQFSQLLQAVGAQFGAARVEGRRVIKAEIAKEVVRDAFDWIIWKKRNEVVFNNSMFTPSLIANDIQAIAFFWFHNRCILGKSVSWLDWSCSPASL